MQEFKQVSWFDDRFYETISDNKICANAKKFFSAINPNYEPLIIPSADNQNKSRLFRPSVTTILSSSPKEWLGKWRGQVGNWEADRIMNNAMDKGSRIHSSFTSMLSGVTLLFNNSKAPKYSQEQIEDIAKESNGLIVISDQQEFVELYRLKQFFNILNPQVVAQEFTVFSDKYFYAGTGDQLWNIEAGTYELGDKEKVVIEKSGIYLLDLKTGAEDINNHPEQLSAYRQAVEESGDIKIQGAMILYSNADKKKGIEGFKVEQYSIQDLDYHFEGFLNQYKVWIKKAPKQPKIFDLPTVLRLN